MRPTYLLACLALAPTACLAQLRVLVTYADASISLNGTTLATLPSPAPPADIRLVYDLTRLGIKVFELLDPDMTVDEACTELEDTDETIGSCEGDTTASIDQSDAATPDDALYKQQYYLPATDVPAAWQQGRFGDPSIRVCAIDTGCDITHPDIQANLFTNQTDGSRGVAFINGKITTSVQDQAGHGTWIAGAIGATTGNGIGIASAAQSVTILACRYLDSTGNGALTDALGCWDWCIQNGAHVASNSWGGTTHLVAMDSAVNALTAAGVLVVASAGNDGVNDDLQVHYPSQYAGTNQGVVSVAASDSYGNLWPQSNYGSKTVTLAAPGVQALGLGLGSLYVKLSGTSMAAPQVSSAAVVLLAYAKSKGVDVDANPALPTALRKALAGGAKQFAAAADAAKVPGGILDLGGALAALDVPGLLNLQRQGSAARASVGATIILAVVFFLAGVLVTAVAVFVRLRFRRPPVQPSDVEEP